jgi:hypothetical protein
MPYVVLDVSTDTTHYGVLEEQYDKALISWLEGWRTHYMLELKDAEETEIWLNDRIKAVDNLSKKGPGHVFFLKDDANTMITVLSIDSAESWEKHLRELEDDNCLIKRR